MSTSSRTTNTSAGLGIDLYPAISVNPNTASVVLSLNQREEAQMSQDCSRKASSLSSMSASSLPYPGTDSHSSNEESSHVAKNGILQEYQYIGLDPSSEYLSNLSSAGTLTYDTNVNTNNFNSSRNAVELNAILGNARSRLKFGATLVQPLESEMSEQERPIALEKAKSRSRVDVDIFLENNMCVEGGLFRGCIKVCIRKHLKKRGSVLISGGKIRVIGFESIADEGERFTFYQCSALLSDVASGLGQLYSSKSDEEGFSMSQEGIHSLPFQFPLDPSEGNGAPKGSTNMQPGISVRYIAMVSFRIKDPISGKKSIAHFYRDCIIWPRLNPSIVLAPTSRPLQLTVSDSLRMDGSGEVYLTASLHRLHWVAGQFCHVQIKVVNNSKKFLKTVSFELLRTLTVFKIVHKADGDEPHCRLSLATKQVAQGALSIGESGTRGHASAKGWWAGIAPGESQTFRHQILIPHDALSIPRGKLLQVSYNMRVKVSAGTLLPTDIQVSLPLEIINFLSIDPPPISFISAPSGHQIATSDSLTDINSGAGSGSDEVDTDDVSTSDADEEDTEGSGNLSIHDDTDEVVQYAVASARIDVEHGEMAPRFADLYYSSLQENLDQAAEQFFDKQGQKPFQPAKPTVSEEINKLNTFAARVEEKRLNLKRRTDIDSSGGNPSDLPKSAASPNSGYRSALSPKPECVCGANPTPMLANCTYPQTESLPMPPQELVDTAISGVALPDGHSPRPRWKEPTTPRPLVCTASPQKKRATLKPWPTTPTRPPGNIYSPSIPRAGSVKDKVRELEGLATQRSVDVEE